VAYARQFSESASAAVGGDLGWVRAEQLDDAVRPVVQGLAPGAVSDPPKLRQRVAPVEQTRQRINHRKTQPVAQRGTQLVIAPLAVQQPTQPGRNFTRLKPGVDHIVCPKVKGHRGVAVRRCPQMYADRRGACRGAAAQIRHQASDLALAPRVAALEPRQDQLAVAAEEFGIILCLMLLALYAFTFVLPWLLLPLGPPAWLAVGANLIQRAVLVARFRHRPETIPLHLVGFGPFFGIALNSWRWHARKRIEWRGRSYAGG
jgi:hypothetical protein